MFTKRIPFTLKLYNLPAQKEKEAVLVRLCLLCSQSILIYLVEFVMCIDDNF